jgi:hypothetical protein
MSANAGLFPERVENAAQERIAADRNSKSNSVSAAHREAVRGSVPSAEWLESAQTGHPTGTGQGFRPSET